MEYSQYFESRGTSVDYYDNYKLSAYIQQVLPALKDAKILDIGCGLGQVMHAIQKLSFSQVSGIDVSKDAVEYCKSKGLNATLIQTMEQFCSTNKQKYDLIIMSHVLEHIDKNEIINTLKLIRENLISEKGSFLLVVPNAQSNTGCYWAYEDFTHTTLFTAGSLSYVLKRAGYQQIKFIDTKGTSNQNIIGKAIIHSLLFVYKLKLRFWNIVTYSSFHKPSPQIFTFDVKALVR